MLVSEHRGPPRTSFEHEPTREREVMQCYSLGAPVAPWADSNRGSSAAPSLLGAELGTAGLASPASSSYAQRTGETPASALSLAGESVGGAVVPGAGGVAPATSPGATSFTSPRPDANSTRAPGILERIADVISLS